MKTFPHSTNLVSADHKPESLALVVVFKGGATYEYSGVPTHLYEGLCASTSPGSYLREYIIAPLARLESADKKYPARRIK